MVALLILGMILSARYCQTACLPDRFILLISSGEMIVPITKRFDAI